MKPGAEKIFAGIVLLLFSWVTMAADGQDSDDDNYTFKPLLLDGEDSAGAVLGIEFGLERKWEFGEETTGTGGSDTEFEEIEADGSNLQPDHFFAKAVLNGIWATDEDENPKAFSKANLDLAYSMFQLQKSYDIGIQLAVEGDQSFDNLQSVAAVMFAGQYNFDETQTTYVSWILGLGEVDASEDDGRKTVTDDDRFDRLEAEIHVNIGLDQGNREYAPKAVGINYRLFKEDDPPSSVRAANLDKFKLVTLSVKFEKGLYIAYSEGNLPFDREDDKIFEIGLTHNLF